MGCSYIVLHIVLCPMNIQGVPFLSYVWKSLHITPKQPMGPTVRYIRKNFSILSMEVLKYMFEIDATNLRIAREKGGQENKHIPTKLQPWI